MDYRAFLKGKKITIMGLGLLGRGINLVKFLYECGANLTVTDLKSKDELAPALEELKGLEGIEYVLGGHNMEDFKGKGMIVRAAGVPIDSPYIDEARKNGIPVEMDASLFAKLSPTETVLIGVTGTRGKSTVSHIIFEALKEAGKKVFLGGNVRGMATLPLLKEVSSGDHVVLELDSWQLQGFHESEISPHIAVFTTFFPDHLNYYKGDLPAQTGMKRYFADKTAIFKYQSKEDYLIIGSQAKNAFKEFDAVPRARALVADANSLPRSFKLNLPGEHNRYNAGVALKTLEVLGLQTDDALQAIGRFKSLPGRLEKLSEKDGVEIYNDTNSTTPDALLAALSSFPHDRLILIAGGTDKDLDYTTLKGRLDDVKAIFLLPGTATQKMKEHIKKDFTESPDLSFLVKKALEVAQSGDTVLFSPGATSFGLFKNEYDRGDKFVNLIETL